MVKKVICTNNNGATLSLTLNKSYTVIEEAFGCYLVIGDSGIENYWSTFRFKKFKEKLDPRLG